MLLCPKLMFVNVFHHPWVLFQDCQNLNDALCWQCFVFASCSFFSLIETMLPKVCCRCDSGSQPLAFLSMSLAPTMPPEYVYDSTINSNRRGSRNSGSSEDEYEPGMMRNATSHWPNESHFLFERTDNSICSALVMASILAMVTKYGLANA